MRIGRKRWRDTRDTIGERDGEPKTRPLAPSGRPYIEVRCHKCKKLLAYAERANRDYFIVPPEMARTLPPPEGPVYALPEAPDIRVIPAGAGIVAIWCWKCSEERFTHSPIFTNRNGGGPK